jgi:hypothetical protein
MRVPDLMIGFLLTAAHITTCLSYSHSYSAIAMPHIQQQSLHTTIHTVYFPAIFISGCLLLEHSTTLTALTACTHNYTLQSHYASLADYRRLLKHFSAALPELLYTPILTLLRTLTNPPLRSLKYNRSHTDTLTYTDTLS